LLRPEQFGRVQRIRSVEGVEWAVPLYKSWLRARLADGTRMLVIVVGIDEGPEAIAARILAALVD
jgi:putative ABC transport system permease protein